jgi:hypothetical protein
MMPTTAITNFGGACSTPSLPGLLGDDPTTGSWTAGETKNIDNTYSAVLTQLQAVGAQFGGGKTRTRKDTFIRANAGTWGTASDTNVWTTTDPAGDTNTAAIVSNTGKYTAVAVATSHGPLSLLGADLASADQEILVRAKPTSTSAALGPGLVLRALANFSKYAWLEVLRSGASTLFLTDGVTPASHAQAWSGTDSGDAFWVRFQVIGNNYKWRIWSEQVSEPTAWTGTFTNTLTLGLKVGLYATFHAATDTVAYDHFSGWIIP